MKIVADKNIPFLKGVLEPFADIEYVTGSKISGAHVADADALLIRTRTKCNKQLLENSKVRFIATATIGSDHIDKTYCEQNGIKWVAAEGCNSNAVLQYITSSLLHLAGKYNFDLKERTLGVVGVGNIGKKVVSLAELLEMRVILNDPPRERNEGACGFNSLQTIQKECDIITFHVPLIREGEDKTFHLCNSDFLERANSGSFIINSSRGEVIHNNDLLNYIKSGKISGSVLDVWENEPYFNTELLENISYGTFHIAGYSLDGKANGTTAIVNKLSMHFDLPLTEWKAAIDEDKSLTLNIQGKNKSFIEILREVVFRVYPISEDDKKLRDNPSGFEHLRNNYNYRRDFTAWTLNIDSCDSDVKKKLQKLGFTVVV